ncbi:MAG: PilZ domain-containing protein, partial [Deltaproteobacteria bacterium]|nr:PilZ domain-containing protein [Deltaproteobacteria bacterium]
VLINDLTDSLPVAKMRLDPQTAQIMASVETEALVGAQLFTYVAERLKSQKLQRQIRRFPRKKTLFNLRVRHEFFGKEDFLTNTVDMSQDGMFVIAGVSPPQGTQLRIQVQELGGEAWIEAVVRWCVPWGRSTSHYPGFGVQFKSIDPAQERKLLQLIGLVASEMPTPDELGSS